MSTDATYAAEEDRRGDAIRTAVRDRYGAVAREVLGGGEKASCCGPSPSGSRPCCGEEGSDSGSGAYDTGEVSRGIYESGDESAVPPDAMRASLGSGNPTSAAGLQPGEVVLDLGAGGGVDVLLAARRVGPDGFAYGLDATPEMVQLARKNMAEAGIGNAEFLEGYIESIPLPDHTVDVVISNCVINLSPDKGRVLREAFRVLRPGGRFVVSDIVVLRELPDEERRDLESWAGCVAGALDESTYRELLADAGFADVEIRATRELRDNAMVSALVTARVPARKVAEPAA